MKLEDVFNELDSALTITDLDGKIIYMNHKSMESFQKYGGSELMGKSLYDCHSEKSNQIIKEMLASGNGNTYILEKKGICKLMYQMPWKQNAHVMGILELSITLPSE